MANRAHIAMLKRGVEAWNDWRQKNPHITPDLSQVTVPARALGGANLAHANLTLSSLPFAILEDADLSGANLELANLSLASLMSANLRAAHLHGCTLMWTNCLGTNFTNADLSGAALTHAILASTGLHGANLRDANLAGAHLTDTDLTDADLTGAAVGGTVIAATILDGIIGLNRVRHYGPSTIGIDTIYRSQSAASDIFFRAAGVPEELIKQVRAHQCTNPFYSCFLCYANKDAALADQIYQDLLNHGVTVWYADEDLKIGDEVRSALDEAIWRHDKLLLIFSQHSVASNWVAHEVERAIEKERTAAGARTVLFPIRTDDSVLNVNTGWGAEVKGRYIGDFTHWSDRSAYHKAFTRLLRDLTTHN